MGHFAVQGQFRQGIEDDLDLLANFNPHNLNLGQVVGLYHPGRKISQGDDRLGRRNPFPGLQGQVYHGASHAGLQFQGFRSCLGAGQCGIGRRQAGFSRGKLIGIDPRAAFKLGLHILGIFLGVLTLWLTEAIDWPSLLLLAALAFIPELSFSGILAESIGGTTFSFLLFTFLCTHALAQTPFVRRVALAFVNSRAARRGPWAFSLLFFLSALTLGLFQQVKTLEFDVR